MELKLEEKTEKLIVVELPYYAKDGNNYAKVIKEGYGGTLQVNNAKRKAEKEIQFRHHSFAYSEDMKPCTKEEFMEAYNTVIGVFEAYL